MHFKFLSFIPLFGTVQVIATVIQTDGTKTANNRLSLAEGCSRVDFGKQSVFNKSLDYMKGCLSRKTDNSKYDATLSLIRFTHITNNKLDIWGETLCGDKFWVTGGSHPNGSKGCMEECKSCMKDGLDYTFEWVRCENKGPEKHCWTGYYPI
jgi:hypothetical protein